MVKQYICEIPGTHVTNKYFDQNARENLSLKNFNNNNKKIYTNAIPEKFELKIQKKKDYLKVKKYIQRRQLITI